MNRPGAPDLLIERTTPLALQARRTREAQRRVARLLLMLDIHWPDLPVSDRSRKMVSGARQLAVALQVWKVEGRPVTTAQIAARLGQSEAVTTRAINVLIGRRILVRTAGGAGPVASAYELNMERLEELAAIEAEAPE